MGTAMSEAVQAEAEGIEMATVEWGELSPFQVPRYRIDWPFDAVVAFEQEQWPSALKALLPEATQVELRSLRLSVREVMPLLAAISDALGFEDQGESPASTS